VGTEKGLLWYDTQSGNFDRVHPASAFDGEIQASAITLLYKDSRGLFWIQPGWGNGIIMFDNKRKIARKFIITDKNNFLPLFIVNFVAEDKEGNVWFAENGLIRWNRQKEQFDTLMTSYYGYNKENTKILSLRNDEEGNLIFCNDQNGVLIYDPRRNNYRQISVGSGLEENAVYHAVPISNHSIWVVSHNYISVIDRNESKSISYSYADSLPQKLFITSYHDSIGKRIFLGYENTIAWVSDTVVRKRDRPIAFYIDAVNIGDDTTIYFPPEKLSLGYEQNEITIHFSALNYYEPQSNRYTYRVNQKPWETIGNENVLRFSRLSPGNYEIEIKYYTASDLNAETIKKINIVIDPPFWRTWWFYSIILVLIATAGFLVYEKHINTVKQRAYIDKQMAEYEIKALHAQMNPHFIFNCLNSIREMILNNENRNASHYLSKFAQLIRITLQQSSRPFISLENTIDYLQRYMEMEKIRSSHFEYHIHLDKMLTPANIFLPPMLIQPFIENAIWHGLSGINDELRIDIRFIEKDDQLLCIIDDNGIGIERSIEKKKEAGRDHQAVGITNTRERIKVLNEKYNMKSEIIIEDKNGKTQYNESGTLVTIYLPLKNTVI
jgi:hypothetical protein